MEDARGFRRSPEVRHGSYPEAGVQDDHQPFHPPYSCVESAGRTDRARTDRGLHPSTSPGYAHRAVTASDISGQDRAPLGGKNAACAAPRASQ